MDKVAQIKALMAYAQTYLLSCQDISQKTKASVPDGFHVTKKLIKANMQLWKVKYAITKAEIQKGGEYLRVHLFREMLFYATLFQHVPGVLGDREELEGLLSEVIFNYDPNKVVNKYQNNPSQLLKALAGKEHKGDLLTSKYLKNSRTWNYYSKTIITSAAFFNDQENVTGFLSALEKFGAFSPEKDDPIKFLTKNIFNVGPAVASNYIKELGFCNYVKPDTHVIKICIAAGLVDDRDAKKTCHLGAEIVRVCHQAKIVPYEFDRLIWMVGSGLFVVNANTQDKLHVYMKTDKEAFIRGLKRELKRQLRS